MVFRRFAYRLGTRTLLSALTFPVSILVARALGPHDRATLGYGMAIASLATLLGHLGMHWRLSREFRRGDLDEQAYRAGAIEVGCYTGVLTALATAVVFWVYSLRGPRLPGLAVIAAYAVLSGWYSIGQRVVLFLEQHGLYNRNSVLKTVCDLGMILAALALLHDRVNGILIAHFAALGLGLMAIFWGLRWRPWLTVAGRARWVSWMRVRESLRFQAMPVLAVLNEQAGVFIVGLIPPSVDAGTYVVAASIGGLLMMIPESLQTVIIGNAYAIRTRADVGRYLDEVRIGCLFYVLLNLVAIPLGYWVFPLLFGPAYAGLGMVYVAVAVASCFRGIRLLLTGLYAGLDRPEQAALIAGVGLTARLVLMPPVVLHLGVLPMAWTSALVALLECALSVRECSRLSGVDVAKRLLPSAKDLRRLRQALAAKIGTVSGSSPDRAGRE